MVQGRSYLSVVNSDHNEESCILPVDEFEILIFNERALDETQVDIHECLVDGGFSTQHAKLLGDSLSICQHTPRNLDIEMPNGLCWLLTTFSGYSGASLGGEEAVLEEDPSDHMVPLVLFFFSSSFISWLPVVLGEQS